MKILTFNNTEKHQPKIEKIKKYGTYQKFWFDFENKRTTSKEDYLYFIKKIYPQAYYFFNGHKGVKKKRVKDKPARVFRSKLIEKINKLMHAVKNKIG